MTPVCGPDRDRITLAALRVLAVTLAAVYLFSALTMPGGHAGVAAGEAGIGALELAWVAAVSLMAGRRAPYLAGVALQLVLGGLWVLTRAVGLPGIGRLPVGEFDLLCAADAVLVAMLAWRAAPARSRSSDWVARGRLGLCQLAVALAAATVFMSMASMMTLTSSAAAARWPDGHSAPRFFCHLL